MRLDGTTVVFFIFAALIYSAMILTGQHLLSVAAVTAVLALVGLALVRDTADYYLTLWHLRRGDVIEAQRAADRMATVRPKYWRAHLMRAVAAAQRGDGVVAEGAARQVLALKPGQALGYNALGNALFAQMRYPEALDAYEEVLKRQPEARLVHYNIGVLHYRTQRYAKAEVSLREALRRPLPNATVNLLGYYYLGQALVALGERSAAEVAFSDMTAYKSALAGLQQQQAAISQPTAADLLQRRDIEQIAALLG